MNPVGNSFNRQKALAFKDKLDDYKRQEDGTFKKLGGDSSLSIGDKVVIINPESISVNRGNSYATYTRPAVIATINEFQDDKTMICDVPVIGKKNIKKKGVVPQKILVNEKTEFFTPKAFFSKWYNLTKISMDSTNTALDNHHSQCKKAVSRLDDEISQKKKEKQAANKTAEDISRFKKTIARDAEELENFQASL